MTATSHTSLAEDKKSPLRKCVATGESYDKSELLRFVISPDGVLTFDLNHKLPGRGAYVKADVQSLRTALSKNLFGKSLKEKITTPPDMAEQIIGQIKQSSLQMLAMARRAGDAVAGTEKSMEAARKYKCGAVILASDAGTDAKKFARNLVLAKAGMAHDAPVISEFNRDELGQIFGREQAVVIFMREGRLAGRFLLQISQYQTLKGLEKPLKMA